jgi:MFS transporter, MHS family, proline/betaine transporter
VQGLSSLGEIMGAQVYLTEITRPPARYTVVALTAGVAAMGSTMALAVASLCTTKGWDWRYVFLFGASIAVIGSVARTRLRETPEFLQARANRTNQTNSSDSTTVKKSYLAYFLIHCTRPFFFYFIYVYMGDFMRTKFGFSAIDVIHQNFFVAAIELCQTFFLVYLTLHFHPMRILRLFSYFGFAIMLLVPYLLGISHNANDIFLVQILCVLFAPDCTPAQGFLCSHMPVLKRFTSMSVLYALSRAFMYSIVTFGMVILVEKFGYFGLLFVGVPLCIGFAWGVHHFRQLAKLEQNQSGVNTSSHLVVEL